MKLFKHFLAGAAFALGILAISLTVVGVRAAQLSLFTGPGGSNPVNQPNLLVDLNTLVNNINSALAPVGTGTVPNFMSLTGSTITTSAGTIGFTNPGDWTNNKGMCGGAGVACFIVYDATGTIHYIPAY